MNQIKIEYWSNIMFSDGLPLSLNDNNHGSNWSKDPLPRDSVRNEET